MTRPDPIDEALALVADDRAQILAKLAAAPRPLPGPIDYLPGIRLRHWGWSVEDRHTGETLAAGRTVTHWGATRRRHRAYNRWLNFDGKRAIETSPILNRYRSWVN